MCKVFIKGTESYEPQRVYVSVKYLMEQMEVRLAVANGEKVLLKPNMLSRSGPDKSVTTHPEILNAVITVLKEWGVATENMLIADSGGGPTSAALQQSSYSGCGFAEVSRKSGVALYTKIESRVVKTDGVIVKEFELIAPAVDCDVIINLAKFKTHMMTGMSGAVKNIFGTISGLKKAEFHMRFPQKENFAKMLVDLCETVKPRFTIVDAVVGMQGDGPSGGSPIALGFIMAGENPYFIDNAMAYMMGFDPLALPVIKEAMDRKLCPLVLPAGTIVGDTALYKKIEGFIMPKSYGINFSDQLPRAISWATPTVEKLIAPKPKVDKKACIGCGKCRDICPKQVITIKDQKAHIELKNCIRCFCCHEMCPVKAIAVKRFVLFN